MQNFCQAGSTYSSVLPIWQMNVKQESNEYFDCDISYKGGNIVTIGILVSLLFAE